MMYKIGSKVQFTYPNFSSDGIAGEGMPDYAEHSGQWVFLEREDPEAFTDGDGNPCRGFVVRADDGWKGVVWPGELRGTDHPRKQP